MKKMLGVIIVVALGIYVGTHMQKHSITESVSTVASQLSKLSQQFTSNSVSTDLNDEIVAHGLRIGDSQQDVERKLGVDYTNLKDLSKLREIPITYDSENKIAALEVPKVKHGLKQHQFTYGDVLKAYPGRVWIDEYFNYLVVMDENVRLVFDFYNKGRITLIKNPPKNQHDPIGEDVSPTNGRPWGKIDANLNITWQAADQVEANGFQQSNPQFPQSLLNRKSVAGY